MTKLIVFDVDGTLANVDHRRHFVERPNGEKKDWKSFNDHMVHDTAHVDIMWMAQTFAVAGNRNIICTGRHRHKEQVTRDFLQKFNVPFVDLFMRPDDDFRDDSIVKVELLQEIRAKHGEPWLWLDDRSRVVDAVRAAGVRVLQVAPGDF